MEKNQIGIILLTYKGKALLMYKFESAIDDEQHEWTFIRAIKKSKESLKETICIIVEKEVGIKIEDVEEISDKYFHARLTDKNVNQIIRKEGQLLDFFSLGDLQKLHLEAETKAFVDQHSSLI